MSFAKFASTTSPLTYQPPERPDKKPKLQEPYPAGTPIFIRGRPHRVLHCERSLSQSRGPWFYVSETGSTGYSSEVSLNVL